MARVVFNSNCLKVLTVEECERFHAKGFRMDVLVSVIIILTLGRYINSLRVSSDYGPLIKMLNVMTKSLFSFMIIWLLNVSTFTFVSMIYFGELEFFKHPI